MKKTIESVAYLILFMAFLCWLGLIIFGFIAAMPQGLIGLLVLAAIGGLFFVALHDQWTNEENKYYQDNVDI